MNYSVADLLESLRIDFTKSRARRRNDNGLVESKNGSVVRKLYGYSHVPQTRYSLTTLRPREMNRTRMVIVS